MEIFDSTLRVVDSGEKAEEQQVDRVSSSCSASQKRHSPLQRMKPWSGVYEDQLLIIMVLRPFRLLANPVICWAFIVIAFAQTWNVVVSLVLAQVFTPPPYSLDSAHIGYLSTGPIVAGLISCVACGFITDKIALVMSKRNNGIFEPEFRLLVILISPIFSTVGYFLFGQLSDEGRSPALISFVWGLAFVSAQVISAATGSYLVDAYRELDVQIFVLSMSVKNFLFFGASCKSASFLSIRSRSPKP